jgi:Ca-activated chloride channel family protein
MTNKPRIEILAEKERLIEGAKQNVDVLIRITPPEQEAESRRPKLNLGIALDRSGSMDGTKMKEARDAAKFCVDQLLSSDRFSAVIFDDRVDVLFTNQPVTDREMLHRGIDRIEARGSTALHEGWVQAGIQVSEDLDAAAINRVLLITDGLANVGETNVDRIVSHASELAGKGISTTTIGIGRDFNEDLLLPMAEAGGGNGWHVREPEDMVGIFETELHGLSRQFAHSVRLRVSTAEGVRVTDVLNDFEQTGNGDYILPNLLSGSPLEIVVRIEVQSTASMGAELFSVALEYIPQSWGMPETVNATFDSPVADREIVDLLVSNRDVVSSLQMLLNARARREAMNRIDEGDREGALDEIDLCTFKMVAASPDFGNSEVFRAELEDLQSLRSSLQNSEDDKMVRKQMAYRRESLRKGKP